MRAKRKNIKREQKGNRKGRREDDASKFASNSPFPEKALAVEKVNNKPLSAMTEAQGHYICSILSNVITFGIGPAGTGKSYVAVSIACEKLKAGEIDKIIITRPAVEAGESFGFLPGELEEKYAPYLDPIRSIFYERLGKSYTEYLIKTKRIEALPLAFMRGSTFKDAFIILDEAQNTSPEQMKMFLTRIGKNVTVVVDGDTLQKDISGKSGLSDAVKVLNKVCHIDVISFDVADVVRSGIVKDILIAYGG